MFLSSNLVEVQVLNPLPFGLRNIRRLTQGAMLELHMKKLALIFLRRSE